MSMIEASLWVLVFIQLTTTGVVTQEIDIYGDMDECYVAAEDIIIKAGDPEPWNWDFVCLEYRLNEVD